MPEYPWPAWPLILRTSSSQEEPSSRNIPTVREFAILTKAFLPDATGKRVAKLQAVHVEITGGKLIELPDSAVELPCDLALLAMGFVHPEKAGLVDELDLALDARGNIVTDAKGATSVARIFAAGDASRGQSLVVWAIADGRRVAAGVHAALSRGALRAAGWFEAHGERPALCYDRSEWWAYARRRVAQRASVASLPGGTCANGAELADQRVPGRAPIGLTRRAPRVTPTPAVGRPSVTPCVPRGARELAVPSYGGSDRCALRARRAGGACPVVRSRCFVSGPGLVG